MMDKQDIIKLISEAEKHGSELPNLEFVEKEKITIKECENLLQQISRITINRDLQKLQEIGLIKQVGESINTFYVSTI